MQISQMPMMKEMIEFNKTAFDNTFSNMAMVQEQAERMLSRIMEQAAWLPKEGKKAMTEWLKLCKQGSETFKKAVDDGFQMMEAFVA